MQGSERKNEWLCIRCGMVLGRILGGELYPSVAGQNLHTSGPNLTVVCPDCGATKVFYTSDPVVRAIYQLVSAISDTAAKAMIEQLGVAVNAQRNK